MNSKLPLQVHNQPDDYSCGPTCLHAVYTYYNETVDLNELISETEKLEDGGTLGVLLANHALRRGFQAYIYSYNLMVFDPTWFELEPAELRERLEKRQRASSGDPKLSRAIQAYIDFIDLGGEVRFEDLNISLIRRYLRKNIPILTGLSATWLYRCAREHDAEDRLIYDDIIGHPCGHFVVLSGYDKEQRKVRVSDPFHGNPAFETSTYWVGRDRLVTAILLGIVTYDSNLLIIQPKDT